MWEETKQRDFKYEYLLDVLGRTQYEGIGMY